MTIVWGRATSINVQVVMWAAAEIGLKVVRKDVGGSFGGTDTSEYRAMNPNGLVPAFQDGDLILFESAAIVRYLGSKYGTEAFWPTDPKARAKLDIWAEWSKATLYPVLLSEIFTTLIWTPESERDMDNFALQVSKLGELMELAEAQLMDKPFLGGDQLNFADVAFGHMLYRYFTLEIERRELPNLKNYYDQLQERAAYRNHVMVDYRVLIGDMSALNHY